MIGHFRFHSRGDAECFVNTSEVIVHEVDSDGMSVVFHFLRKRIGKTGESAHVHSHRQVLTFDVAG